MAKNQKSSRPPKSSLPADADLPVVGMREPCPCGSGRRYKGCHGRGAIDSVAVRRSFEGLGSETDWVALREIVPSATAPLTLAPEYAARLAGREVTLATVLPMAWPALVRMDGHIFVGLQTATHSGAVADGTISRSATQSVSDPNPSNDRRTATESIAPRPWHPL